MITILRPGRRKRRGAGSRPAFSLAAALAVLLSLAGPPRVRAEEAPRAETKTAAPAPASASPAEGEQKPEKKQPETLLEFAIAGGYMMIPLLVTSVLWVGFFMERLIVLRRSRVAPPALARAMRSLLDARPFDRERALSVAAAHPSPAATILRSALERLDLPLEKVEKAVQYAAEREVFRLRDNLWIFAVISTISPLLGLLGTVVGLVQAFREVAITGLGAGATLAPGIYEALVTTVAGLAIAIPALASYYWLQARVDRYVHDIDGLVVEITETADLSPAGV